MDVKGSAAAAMLGRGHVERRERRPVTMCAYALRADSSVAEVLVLDLSYEGCGIETPIRFDAGEAIRLSVVGLGLIKATVRWVAGSKAGLVFAATEPEKQPQFWPRRYERTTLTAEVSLRRLGKFNYRVRVFDMSLEGCKVELVDMPQLDEHILVRLEGLEPLQSKVCWIDGMSAGLRFEKAIHPAVFAMLLKRLTSA